MQTLAYDGSPVRVTLDASESSDADGRVVEYRWFNGTKGDGGVGRAEPDPDDVVTPTVMLEEGVWTFTLFVVDDAGGVSLPATVTIMVGEAVAPEVTACAEAALDTIGEDCRTCVCGQSEVCRTAIAACDQACWDFYRCVQNNCADVADSELSGCVRASCADFFAGAVAYMSLEPCLQESCGDTCAASVRTP